MASKKKKAAERGQHALDATPRALGYRMPAEWEPHAATWLAWPHNESDWPGKFGPVPWVFAELARVISEVERVRLIVANATMERAATRALRAVGTDLKQIDFVRLATNRSWTRDFLPLSVVRGSGKKRGLGSVKWQFNGWARYPDFEHDERAGERVADWHGAPTWHPTVAGRRVILEGGAIDVDGEGTLITSSACLLTGERARNPVLGRSVTELVLGEYLGVDHVIWLDEGIAGDDTAGHVDDFARFVAPGRVVVAFEPSRSDPNHRPLRRAKAALEAARDAQGHKLDVVPLPMPASVVFAGQRLPASYANFYLCNETVLVPTFTDPADAVALGIFRELYPRRRVIGVPCRDLALGLGTLHCSTQQEPKAG